MPVTDLFSPHHIYSYIDIVFAGPNILSAYYEYDELQLFLDLQLICIINCILLLPILGFYGAIGCCGFTF